MNPKPPLPAAAPATTNVTVTHLGGLGDGIAEYKGKPLYIPYSCAGDKLRVSPTHPRAKILEILEASPQRQTPPCPHFSDCGGCSLQQLNPASYAAFKQSILSHILARLGADESVIQPLIEIGALRRRRAEFKVSHIKKGVEIGFFAAKSHRVVPLHECLVLEPSLFAAIAPLRTCITQLSKPHHVSAINATELEGGLDITIKLNAASSKADSQYWATFARTQPWLRLSLQHENSLRVIHDSGAAQIRFGNATIALPAGAFLQAAHKAEQAMTALVTQHLKSCQHPLDLYAGCGTYSFPLLQQSPRVTAIEGAAAMVNAMQKAALKHPLGQQLHCQRRDLYRSPLTTAELAPYDGIVINPPRNGAWPQIQQIAASNVEHLVMVSCNPATFTRDAACLLQNGYKITAATAIDQFYWSSHLEIIAAFKKT